ncbi:hypothetical protein BGZ46_002062, partial [Entomortierella lignicola]
KFNTGSKLTSLHGTFGSKLISALRAEGHAVVGINEYYTSKKCPWNKPAPGKTCGHGFVGQANMRRMYCPGCMMPFHRDCMAAQNMVRAAQSIISTGTRPLDLQPLDDNNQPSCYLHQQFTADSAVRVVTTALMVHQNACMTNVVGGVILATLAPAVYCGLCRAGSDYGSDGPLEYLHDKCLDKQGGCNKSVRDAHKISQNSKKQATKDKGSIQKFPVASHGYFWANYALKVKTKVTAMNAGVIAHDLGLQQAKISSEQLISSYEDDQLDIGSKEDEEGEEDEEGGEEDEEGGEEDEEGGEGDEERCEEDEERGEEDEERGEDEEEQDECNDIDDQELNELLRNIEESGHDICEWFIDDECVVCQFQKYQKNSIEGMIARDIIKTDIADAMASFGVFVPHLPTKRMISIFGRSTLEKAAEAIVLETDDQNDIYVMKAVRHRLNNKRDEACGVLKDIKDRKLRIIRIEHLPLEKEKGTSEDAFVARFVTPVLLGTLRAEDKVVIDFPNKDSTTQRLQSMKPNRPDIVARAFGQELLFGKVTGPCQENFKAKNAWDLYRIARYGKSLLDLRYPMAPLIQVVHNGGCYMRMTVKARGKFLLQRVGSFVIPTSIEMIPSLLGTLQTLAAVQNDLKKLTTHAPSIRKRSWNFLGLKDPKKRLVSINSKIDGTTDPYK